MSKERLEEIAYNVGDSLDGEKALMSSDDYDFLYNYALEQAERVQELEVWYHSYHKEAKLNNILKIQNKRYREALEEILAEAYEEAGLHPDTGMQLETYIARIARQALEGEGNA